MNVTKHTLTIKNTTIEYELQRKKVKNINLRIRQNGSIFVSASRWISKTEVERFLLLKADFILHAMTQLDNRKNPTQKPYFAEDEICGVILSLCQKVYPHFAAFGVPYPTIKFRKMVSRWGSCQSQKGILTFNTNLRFAPPDCIEYVVLHEFTHFLQPNHQKPFYNELEKVCPNWKTYKKQLQNIYLR